VSRARQVGRGRGAVLLRARPDPASLRQLPFWQRALWFLFVGWWACGIALSIAYVASLTIVLLPVGLMIFNRVPAVMTLQRN
jgi:uncharacterized membrane protein YccF (DUF307 family)